jgi:hypothetical protein
VVQRAIRDETRFCESNGDRKIRDYAVGIRFAGVAIETGRKIDGKHTGALIYPQLIDRTTRSAYGFAQRRPRANAKQAVKNNCVALASSQSFIGRVPLPRVWRVQWRQLFLCQLAAILLPKGKADFDFPPAASQTFRCNQGVARVVAFSSEHNALARLREKFANGLRDSGACLVH